tara:strand:- start:10713 stop:12287 length:1575 start_codon:yes stop_codon:yes gene_type:complete
MSLLPSTLLNASSNEDQTLEIHSEILEPLAHSQTLARWEIPHKNIMDSDSVLIWNINWELQNGGTADHRTDGSMVGLPLAVAGLYDTIKRARLYVNGKIISELNEVGKYLTLKSNFQPHEVKTEVSDLFSYADNELANPSGQVSGKVQKIQRTPGDKELGLYQNANNNYRVEASLKLHQLFSVLKDAQLDTNSINGKIMIEIDWNVSGVSNNATWVGSGVAEADKKLTITQPRLILDFLTYNDEVLAQIKNTIFGDGPGINMPYREVALVRKNINPTAQNTAQSQDFAIGMTGRAVQKIFVAKVMNVEGNDVNNLMGECRSDLLQGQEWNIRVNDLMIFDRNVNNRAEEFNYVQQTGEAQFTCPPASFEKRDSTINAGYTTDDNQWVATQAMINTNTTPANLQGTGNVVACPVVSSTYYPLGEGNDLNVANAGANIDVSNVAEQRMGRQNYLAVNLAKYMNGAESPLNAIRVGSTPIIFQLNYNASKTASVDTNTTAKSGTAYFFVEYLKMMNLKNGEVSVVDL